MSADTVAVDRIRGRILAHDFGPSTLAAFEAAVRHEHGERIAKAIEDLRVVCPIHSMPDCSALLNGCALPQRLRGQLEAVSQLTRALSPAPEAKP